MSVNRNTKIWVVVCLFGVTCHETVPQLPCNSESWEWETWNNQHLRKLIDKISQLSDGWHTTQIGVTSALPCKNQLTTHLFFMYYLESLKSELCWHQDIGFWSNLVCKDNLTVTWEHISWFKPDNLECLNVQCKYFPTLAKWSRHNSAQVWGQKV